MLKNKTVFVLGAGASYPYNYPLGYQLLLSICDAIDRPGGITRNTADGSFKKYEEPYRTMFNTSIGNRDDWVKFSRAMRRSHIPSVDSFLEVRPEFMEFGKIAIAAQLIPKEVDTYLVRGQGAHDEKTQYQWYDYLYSRIGSKLEDFENPNFSIVTFNYDRSFEFFYFISLLNSFGSENALRLYEKVPIVHFYGILDPPNISGQENGRGYGETPSNIVNTANKLSLISERNEMTPQIEEARALIANSEQIIFLGFGYAPENIKRLFQANNLQRECVIRGTSFGMKHGEISPVEDSFRNIYNKNLYAEDKDILTFLRETELYSWDFGEKAG